MCVCGRAEKAQRAISVTCVVAYVETRGEYGDVSWAALNSIPPRLGRGCGVYHLSEEAVGDLGQDLALVVHSLALLNPNISEV